MRPTDLTLLIRNTFVCPLTPAVPAPRLTRPEQPRASYLLDDDDAMADWEHLWIDVGGEG